jgi:hypothetical protein
MHVTPRVSNWVPKSLGPAAAAAATSILDIAKFVFLSLIRVIGSDIGDEKTVCYDQNPGKNGWCV